MATEGELLQSAKSCSMCNLMQEAKNLLNEEAIAHGSEDERLVCRLHQPETGTAKLEIKASHRHAFLDVYTPRCGLEGKCLPIIFYSPHKISFSAVRLNIITIREQATKRQIRNQKGIKLGFSARKVVWSH